MDALLLQERISQTIILGESQFREFKSALDGPAGNKKARDPKAVAKDIAETLVAFANADGGELLVGVEDDSNVTGFLYGDDTVRKLLDVPRTGIHPETPLESPLARRVLVQEKDILYFSVEKGTRSVAQTVDGKCLQRKDLESRPVSVGRLQFERQEQMSREYDRHFVDGAKVSDLDVTLIKRVSDQVGGMSVEKCLQYLGLAAFGTGVLRLQKAAVLLFAKDVARWHPRCQVRVIRIRGTELRTGRDYNAISDETAHGNILQLVTEAWEKLRPHLVETKMTPDALFKERVMYPEDACREALINAITHRDYAVEGQGIEIFIFDDRMEVRSPGNLLSSIPLEALRELRGNHESRNALVARTLKEIGYVREMGEGMRRIFRLMRDADLVPPELQSEAGRFCMILHHKSVFSDTDQRWLDEFRPFKLTREEMLIALLGKEGNLLSPQQIYARLSLVDWDVYRSIIEQIQAKGVVYNTMPERVKVQKARVKKLSQRSIPRLAVRQPADLEQALSGLYGVLRDLGPTSVVNPSYVNRILEGLPPQNPYHTNSAELTKTLRLLTLIDDARLPTSVTIGLWGQSAMARADAGPPATRRVPRRSASARELPGPIRRPATPAPDLGPTRARRETDFVDVFVGNLNYDASSQEVEALFSKYGEIVVVKIPPDFVTGLSRGFAFVRMSDRLAAAQAIEKLNGQLLRGRQLRVSW
jgi:ATP-dependent DNA helicase RecG